VRESGRAKCKGHRYPGQVHPADRLGRNGRHRGPGCLATSWLKQPGWALLSPASSAEFAFELNSLDRSWRPSYHPTSWTLDLLAGTAGQLRGITSPKGSACTGRSLCLHLGLGRNTSVRRDCWRGAHKCRVLLHALDKRSPPGWFRQPQVRSLLVSHWSLATIPGDHRVPLRSLLVQSQYLGIPIPPF
jgi:hypothetical protein